MENSPALGLISGSWEVWVFHWLPYERQKAKVRKTFKRERPLCIRLHLLVMRRVKWAFQDLLVSVNKQEWKILKENFHLILDLISGSKRWKEPSKTSLWVSRGKSENFQREFSPCKFSKTVIFQKISLLPPFTF